MKYLLLTLVMFLVQSCNHFETVNEPARTPSQAGASERLKDIIRDEKNNSTLVNEVGPSCATALINMYNADKTLRVKYIEQSLIPLESPALKNCSHNSYIPLYHYTSSKYVINNFSNPGNTNYAELIAYSRTQKTNRPIISVNGFSNSVKGVLYVSMYPNTSTEYGNSLLTLWVDKNLKVVPRGLFGHFYSYGLTGAISPELKKIIKELPTEIVEKCNMANIALFILEDSGADLVDYIPNTNQPSTTPYNSDGWFYLLNAQSVRQHSINSFSKIGVDANELQKKFDSQGRKCELLK